jgi:hypothetical protein
LEWHKIEEPEGETRKTKERKEDEEGKRRSKTGKAQEIGGGSAHRYMCIRLNMRMTGTR